MPSVHVGLRNTSNFIKPQPQNCMARSSKLLRVKPPHFIPDHRMGALNYMRTGSWSITEKHTGCMRAMVSCSTTRAPGEVERSWRGKLRGRRLRFPWASRRVCTLEILTLNVIGVMVRILHVCFYVDKFTFYDISSRLRRGYVDDAPTTQRWRFRSCDRRDPPGARVRE